LEGKLNPWVLLASGEIKQVDSDAVKGKRVGSILDDGSIVIGKQGDNLDDASRFISKLESLDEAARMDMFLKLLEKGDGPLADKARRVLIGGGEGTRELRKGIPGMKPDWFQAHHIVPRELLPQFKDFFKKLDFNIEDGLLNGIMLPPNKEVLDAFIAEMARKGKSADAETFLKRAFHEGSHSNYTIKVGDDLARLEKQVGNFEELSDSAKKHYKERLKKLINGYKKQLEINPNLLKE